MPGHREMTAVVKLRLKAAETCNHNGAVDTGIGEECDVGGISDAAQALQTAVSQCGKSAGKDAIACQECRCIYPPDPTCLNDPAAACKTRADCLSLGANYLCDSTCQCVEGGGSGQPSEPPATPESNACFCKNDSFPNEAMKNAYRELNDKIVRSTTNLSDDLFVPPEGMVTCIGRVANGAAPGLDSASLATSFSGSPLPDSAGNVRPWMLVQTGGSVFLDTTRMNTITVKTVKEPIRILPLDTSSGGADTKASSFFLPGTSGVGSLGSSSVILPLGDIAPDTTVQHTSYGSDIVNNMVEHRVLALDPSQLVPLSDFNPDAIRMSKTQISVGGLQASSTQKVSGYAFHVFTFRVPPDCGSFAGVEGYEGCPNIEDRKLDAGAVKKELEARAAAAGGKPTSQIFYDLPWEDNLNYKFNIVQSVYGSTAEPEAAPADVTFSFLAGSPQSISGGGGGCKGCYLTAADPELGSILPSVVLFVLAGSGLTLSRRRLSRNLASRGRG